DGHVRGQGRGGIDLLLFGSTRGLNFTAEEGQALAISTQLRKAQPDAPVDTVTLGRDPRRGRQPHRGRGRGGGPHPDALPRVVLIQSRDVAGDPRTVRTEGGPLGINEQWGAPYGPAAAGTPLLDEGGPHRLDGAEVPFPDRAAGLDGAESAVGHRDHVRDRVLVPAPRWDGLAFGAGDSVDPVLGGTGGRAGGG